MHTERFDREMGFCIADGCDASLMDDPFAGHQPDHKPDVVLHTATCKHVPLMERYPAGAFRNNTQAPVNLPTHRSDTTFVFVGHGFHESDVWAAAHRLPNIRCISPQPRHRMMPWFQLASLSLVSFLDRPVLSTNAPAKLFDSLAAGTPIIVTNPGWMTRLVQTHDCGWAVPPSSPSALAEQISTVLDQPDARRAAGQRGAELAHSHFDRATQAPTLQSIFSEVVSETT